MALMGFSDPNAAAAANAGQGLNRLANFLYEQQVQKPATQAQTAGTQAQTAETQARIAMMGPQTQALQQEIVAQTLKNKADLFGMLSQHPMIDVNAINAAANGTSQATDTGMSPPDSNAGKNSPQVSTSNSGEGAALPQLGSSSSPVLPNTQPPTQAGSSTQGSPGTFDASGNPTNARPLANVVKPGTLAEPKFPYTLDDLSPSKTQSGTQPFSATPARGATTTPAPVASPVSPVPAITSPASASKVPQGGFDFRKELARPFYELPEAAQNELLNQMRAPFVKAGLPVSDQELIGHYQGLQAQLIPPAMLRSDFVPTTLQDGKVNGVFRNGIEALSGGDTGGNQSDKARILDPTTGKMVDNPAFTKPAEVESTQSSLDSNTEAQKLLDSAKAALTADPSIVGPKLLGQHVANLARSGEAMIGSPANKTAEATLRRFQSGGFLTSLGGLKGVGRLDIPVVEAAKKGMPEQSDTIDTWNKYIEQAQEALTLNRNALMQELNQQTGGKTPGTALPPVNVSPGVNAPGISATSASQGLKTYTPEEAASLPKGYGTFLGTNGKIYRK